LRWAQEAWAKTRVPTALAAPEAAGVGDLEASPTGLVMDHSGELWRPDGG